MENEDDLNALVADTTKPIKWQNAKPEHRGKATQRIRQMQFLKAFAQCGIVSTACKIAKVSQSTEIKWRTTQEPWYVQQFNAAMEEYKASLEQEVYNRAVIGETVPIIGRKATPFGPEDQIIGYKKVKSDLLLMFHAKRHIPEYKENYKPVEKDDRNSETVSPITRITMRLEMISERKQHSIEGTIQQDTSTVIDVTPEPAAPAAPSESEEPTP